MRVCARATVILAVVAAVGAVVGAVVVAAVVAAVVTAVGAAMFVLVVAEASLARWCNLLLEGMRESLLSLIKATGGTAAHKRAHTEAHTRCAPRR